MSEISPIAGMPKRSASRAESKARTTDNISRSIIDAEVNAREAKTARLRAARLAAEAAAPEPEAPVKKPARKKAVARKA